MKIGIMQPYFVPYLGYFSLIKHTDRFILLDDVQFIRHGWIERNRILKQDGGWQYVMVPIIKEEGRNTLIKNVLINNDGKWKNKILAQLQHYKKRAPYFNPTVQLLNDIFSEEFKDIVSLNIVSLEKICKYLGFEKNFEVFSKMGLQIEEIHEPDEWALNICKSIGNVDEYWNPPNGELFFNREKYDQAGIKLAFQSINLMPYNQLNNNTELGLSIIDVMMFNHIEEINKMLDNYKLS